MSSHLSSSQPSANTAAGHDVGTACRARNCAHLRDVLAAYSERVRPAMRGVSSRNPWARVELPHGVVLDVDDFSDDDCFRVTAEMRARDAAPCLRWMHGIASACTLGAERAAREVLDRLIARVGDHNHNERVRAQEAA